MQGAKVTPDSPGSYFKFLLFFGILTAIILSCMVFGGYSSFVRAENRIASTKTALMEACRARLVLLPELATLQETKLAQDSRPPIELRLEQANALLKDLMDQKHSLDKQTMQDFETSQTELTFRSKELLARLAEGADQKTKGEFEALKQELLAAQDSLYVANENYKKEVLYYNMRITSFPVSYIAKLFDFHKTLYYPFSEQAFLPARKTFES
jgi:LemA protein